MKLVLRSLALLLSLLPSLQLAHAGAESSGGGLGVVCFDKPAILEGLRQGDGLLTDELLPHITSIENFDLYEAKLVRGIKMDLKQKLVALKNGESAEQYVERILKRLDYSVPALARMIRVTVAELAQPERMKRVRRPLARMNDAKQIGLIDYENCMLATMGLNNLDDSGPKLEIDARLEEHAAQDEQSRAIFLLHEYVYITARKLGQTDSRHTRVLINSLITEHEQMTTTYLAGKAQEFGFSGEGRFATYGYEIVLPIVRGALEAALVAYNETRAEAKELIGKANLRLEAVGIQCQYDYFISHCQQTVEGLKDASFNDVVAKFRAFGDKRTRHVGTAVWNFYVTSPVGRARLRSALGIPENDKNLMDEHLRTKTFLDILVWHIDTGLKHPDRRPIDELDLDAKAHEFSRKLEEKITYPLGVVE